MYVNDSCDLSCKRFFSFVASLFLLQISEAERREKVKELAFESIFETKVEHTDYFKV